MDSMSLKVKNIEFQGFTLDLGEKILMRDQQLVAIPPKALELLLVIAERPGHIFEKADLIESVWPDTFVEEGNLPYTITLLRKALGDNAEKPRFIETVPRRGYRFIADVTHHNSNGDGRMNVGPVSKARNSYLRAQYLRRRNKAELITSITHADHAISEDPEFALAYTHKAETYNLMGFYAFLPPAEAFLKAKDAARTALDLDETMPEAYNSLAFVSLFYEWDLAKAEREWLRALELKRNYAIGRQWYANVLTAAGQWDDAIYQLTLAQEIDPASPVLISKPGWSYYYAREYDKAIEPCERAIGFDDTFVYAHLWLGQALERKGEYERAITEFSTVVSRLQGAPEPIALLAHAYAVSGNRKRARAILADLLEHFSERYISPYHVATVYVGMDEKEQAMAWLETAYRDRQYPMVLLKHDPRLDPLRSDPRFRDLLQRITPLAS